MRVTFCGRVWEISTRCQLPIWPAVFWPHRLRFSTPPLEMQLAAAGRRFQEIWQGTTSFPPVESVQFQKCSYHRFRVVFPTACTPTTFLSIATTHMTCIETTTK